MLVVILLCVISGASGCAFIRLNGCTKLRTCGELAVYGCAEELICADVNGNAVRSEATAPQRNYCRVCEGE